MWLFGVVKDVVSRQGRDLHLIIHLSSQIFALCQLHAPNVEYGRLCLFSTTVSRPVTPSCIAMSRVTNQRELSERRCTYKPGIVQTRASVGQRRLGTRTSHMANKLQKISLDSRTIPCSSPVASATGSYKKTVVWNLLGAPSRMSSVPRRCNCPIFSGIRCFVGIDR